MGCSERWTMSKKSVLVIGGGAAGMMAAIFAAENGAAVTLLEPNERLGKKLNITGKGRCNVTNNAGMEELLQNIPRNGKFLYSAFSHFDGRDAMAFFEGLGVPLKTERGNPGLSRQRPLLRYQRRAGTAAESPACAPGPGPCRPAADRRHSSDRCSRGTAGLSGSGRDPGHRRRILSRHRFHR